MFARIEMPVTFALAVVAIALPALMPYLIVAQIFVHIAATIVAPKSHEPRDLHLLTALLAVIALLNAVITPFPAITIPQVLRLLSGIGVFYAALRTQHTAIAPHVWAIALLALSVGSAAADQLGNYYPGVGAYSAPMLFVPLNIALLFAPPHIGISRRIRWLHGAAAALGIVAAFVQTWDALFLIAIGVGAAIAAAVQLWPNTRRILPSLLFILGAGQLFFPIAPRTVANLMIVSPTESQIEQQREIWDRAEHVIRSFPFTGTGMGALGPIIEVLYPPTFSARVQDAEHSFLQIMADLGIPGALILTLLWLHGLRIFTRTIHEAPTTSTKNWIAASTLAMHVPILILASSRVVLWGAAPLAPLLWLVIGAAVRLSSFDMRPHYSQRGGR